MMTGLETETNSENNLAKISLPSVHSSLVMFHDPVQRTSADLFGFQMSSKEISAVLLGFTECLGRRVA